MEEPHSLEKRIRRHVLGRRHKARIKFPHGLGSICLAEAQACLATAIFPLAVPPQLDLTETSLTISEVSFRELLALTMRMTTARDILWIVAEGKATSVRQLKKKLSLIPWDFFTSAGSRWVVKAISQASRVFHEGLIVECIEKELAARGCTISASKEAHQRLDIRMKSDRFEIAISLAGRPLYQRRYKSSFRSIAPLKEDLAAGMVRLVFADFPFEKTDGQKISTWIPFAGSGTLAFESALFLLSIAPEVFFGPLGAENFPCTPQASIKFARNKLRSRWTHSQPGQHAWHLIELDQAQVEALRLNVDAFNAKIVSNNGQNLAFSVAHDDAFKAPSLPIEKGQNLLALLNPPYGDRLGSRKSAQRVYKNIGKLLDELPNDLAICGAILVPNHESMGIFLHQISSFETKKHPVRHGGKSVWIITFSRHFRTKDQL